MSDVSIFGKKWIDIVFEGKNKAYGAYKLRQESPRTTLTAFFFGLLFIGSLCGGGLLLSSFGEKVVIPNTPTLPPVTTFKFDDVKPPEHKPVIKPKAVTDTKKDITKKDLIDPEIVKPIDKPDDINTNAATNTATTSAATGTEGTVTGGDPNPSDAGAGTAITNVPKGPYRVGALDVQPTFPGGIQKFYDYVGNNFQKSENETGRKLTVRVSFVIEKDGTISDVRVVQNPGEGLDKEAIRVLKSLKTKWQPGIKDGQPVRTIFTLPISVLR